MESIRNSSRLVAVTAAIIMMMAAAVTVGQGPPATAEAQAQKPSRPTGLVATASQGDVQLSWNAHDDSITHHKVFRRNVSPGVNNTADAVAHTQDFSTNGCPRSDQPCPPGRFDNDTSRADSAE